MATFTRECLSPGGTQGNGIGIVVNGTTETDIHECNDNATTTYHEVHLWATNIGTSAHTLILLVGGEDGAAAAVAQQKNFIIQPNETLYVSPGFTLRGVNGTHVEIQAKLATNTNNEVIIHGHVNKIDQS